jgi:hypothetical protein
MPPLGSRKTMKLTFNDRFTTQVIFHVKKKQLLRSLVSLASEAVAAQLAVEEGAEWFGDTNELPVCLVRTWFSFLPCNLTRTLCRWPECEPHGATAGARATTAPSCRPARRTAPARSGAPP